MRLFVARLFSVALVSTRAASVQVDDYRRFCACIILTSLKNTANAFSAQQLLGAISASLSSSDLESCNGWTSYPEYEIGIFADSFGEPTSNISASAGAFAPDIYAFCGDQEFGKKLSFPDFSASTAGLLLPWIAIFAQLPRQTGSKYSDLISTFISIGSPSWILSSVLMAVLYRRANNTRFDRLSAKLGTGQTGSIFLQLKERCYAAKIIVQAFIQAPVRLNRRPGVFSSLITFPVNHWWWLAAAEKLEGFWRRIDAIFIVQTFIAVFAWIFAIIADFWTLPGAASPQSSEWQICMGTLWLWVFAAIFGPVAIKSLYKVKALHKALASPSVVYEKVHIPLDGGGIIRQHSQTAIVQRSGLVPQWLPNRRPSLQEYLIMNEDGMAEESVQIPAMLGFSIEGDRGNEGLNTFPYRFFSSWQTRDQVIRGFESLQERLKANQIPDADHDESAIFQTNELSDSAQESDITSLDNRNEVELTAVGTVGRVRTWDSNELLQRNLEGSAKAMDRYLNIDFEHFTAYPEWNEISHDQWICFIIANFFGLVVQCATNGPAIYLMYYSPPVDLGCDSGGLLIYAVGATLSWLLLTMGNLLSHAALLYYQRYHREYPYQPISGHYSRTKFHTFLCGAAVITRVLGKSIAVISACWILIWTFFTYSNVMETPYCTTAYFQLRKKGWMRLWDFEPRQFTSTKVEELQCLLFGSFVAYFACVLIYTLTSDGKTRRARWIIITSLSLGFTVFAIPLYLRGVKVVESVS